MQEPIFEIKTEKEKKDYAMFIISPLEQGYGNTLGNSLRRVLLASLRGAAITSVRISQVRHQFTTLKGMKEDIVDFILNLKKIRIQYEGDKPISAELSAKGPGLVKAGDIKVDSTVKVANPELELATLAKDAKLDVKMVIEAGVGYSPAEDRTTGEIGLIPLDASFSPIKRVNYRVEETRVGRFTNYDKLILEIWTDETVKPLDSLVQSAKILIAYFGQIVSPKKVKVEEEKVEDEIGPIGKLSVEEIGLPTRVANALIKAGYDTVEDLVKARRENLVKVRNLGEKSVKIIEAALGERGLEIKGE